MQHFGLPTRLLDWTENPLAALFFAAWKWDGKTTPVVWMMEAGTLNKITTGVDEMIIPGGSFSENWLPNKCHGEKAQLFVFKDEQYENAKPLAILPKHINRRITAQQSVFTVHGIEQHCISSVFGEAEGNEGLLLQFEMNGCQRKQLLEELATLGISESSLFPELSTLANDLKRELGLDTE